MVRDGGVRLRSIACRTPPPSPTRFLTRKTRAIERHLSSKLSPAASSVDLFYERGGRCKEKPRSRHLFSFASIHPDDVSFRDELVFGLVEKIRAIGKVSNTTD